jgi:hypothetical protein
MRQGTKRLVRTLLLLVAVGSASGCAAAKIRPWDRDLLAEKQMQYIPYPMVHALDEHVYFSKEGSTGGSDAAGGGCGCN